MTTPNIKIADGKFSQGELSFELDAKDLAKALQQVDKLTVAQHRELAKLNNIPTEPFDRRLLRPVILGLVQSAWYKAVKGAVPDKVVAAQQGRVVAYAKQLEDLKNVSADDLVTTRSRKSASPKSDSAPKSFSLYALVADKVAAILAKDPSQRPSETRLLGQQYMVVETIQQLASDKKPATIDSIFTSLKPNPYVISPGKTNISFHINAFKKAGLVVVVDAQGAVVKEEAKAPAAKKEEAKAPAAAPAKKK
jgi:hypothetical protein